MCRVAPPRPTPPRGARAHTHAHASPRSRCRHDPNMTRTWDNPDPYTDAIQRDATAGRAFDAPGPPCCSRPHPEIRRALRALLRPRRAHPARAIRARRAPRARRRRPYRAVSTPARPNRSAGLTIVPPPSPSWRTPNLISTYTTPRLCRHLPTSARPSFIDRLPWALGPTSDPLFLPSPYVTRHVRVRTLRYATGIRRTARSRSQMARRRVSLGRLPAVAAPRRRRDLHRAPLGRGVRGRRRPGPGRRRSAALAARDGRRAVLAHGDGRARGGASFTPLSAASGEQREKKKRKKSTNKGRRTEMGKFTHESSRRLRRIKGLFSSLISIALSSQLLAKGCARATSKTKKKKDKEASSHGMMHDDDDDDFIYHFYFYCCF